MAQQNPVTQSSSLSSAGTSNEPLNTGSGITGTSNHPHTHTTTTTGTTGAGTGGTGTGTGTGIGHEIKSVFAGIHGMGEKARGEFNSGVDRAFNEPEGVAKNDRVAQEGDMERKTGNFGLGTKDREGAVPGADHGRRI